MRSPHNSSPTCCPVSATSSISEIYGRPGTGPVLLGGNYVGPWHKGSHNSEGKVRLHVVDGSSFVAKCCFVGSSRDSKWTDLLLLAHDATIGDLKRTFYERHKTQAIASALTSSGLQGVPEATQLDYLVCRDVDGRWLPDNDKLPTASPTSCSDVGYHAVFYLDICASSMRGTYVKERIKVSPEAIGDFTSTPKTLGAWPFQSTAEYPSTFGQVRSELGKRLTDATRDEPARFSTDELEKVKEAFSAIAKGVGLGETVEEMELPPPPKDEEKEPDHESSTSSLPQHTIRLVESVITDFADRDFDALDPDDFARKIAKSLEVIEPFVRALAHVQTESEWINYASIADPEQEWTLAAIASMTKDLQDAVQLHEDILLLKPNTTDFSPGKRDENKNECMELAKLFELLHKVFDQARTKKGDLERQLHECEEECSKSVKSVTEAAFGYNRQLQDEQSNLQMLKTLSTEGETFHEMVCQQIKWCKSFVAASSADSLSRQETLDREIQRLEGLRKQEITRQENLTKCDEHLDRVLAIEGTSDEVSKAKLAIATRVATERVSRAKKAVTGWGHFQTKLTGLYQEVQQEMKDAASYWHELLKALAVESHAAYVGAGKFLTMQALITEKNLKASEQTIENKYQAKLESEHWEDRDLQETVEKAEHARRDYSVAKTNFDAVVAKVERIKEERKTLKAKFKSIDQFARAGSSSTGDKLVVATLPMKDELVNVDGVEAFRELRDINRVTHTLESLEEFEREWMRRYDGESSINRQSRVKETMRNMFGRLIGI